MTHVHLVRKASGVYGLTVDGVDMSSRVLSEGFRIEIPENFETAPRVHMVIEAKTLEVDLPDAVVKAGCAGGEDGVSEANEALTQQVIELQALREAIRGVATAITAAERKAANSRRVAR